MEKIKNHPTITFLVIITILAAILRFTNLSNNPPGLTVDEVSSGYNSYSILKTGSDEYGNFLPLSFRSLNDYKPPLYIYVSTIPIALFGLNEFSIRFLSAFIGTLTIPLSFFVFKKITNKEEIALLGALLFAISPWHIYYSRLAFESPVAMTLMMTGVFGFLKILEGKYRWAIISAVFFALSLYAYHSERIFVPLFLLFLIAFYRQKLKKVKKNFFLFVLTLGILILPLIYSLIFSPAVTRAGMTIITNDPNFVRNSLSQTIPIKSYFEQVLLNVLGGKFLLLFFYIFNKFLSYLQPSFLFFNGLGMTEIGSFGLGLMYFFEIPSFILGLIFYLQKRNEQAFIIFSWLIFGLLPAAVTQDDLNPIRTLLVTPIIILMSATGIVIGWQFFKKIKPLKFKLPISLLVVGFLIWNFIYAWFVFTIHFPIEKSESFLYGSKQSVLFALSQKNNYQQIVLDPVRGTVSPDIRNVPHLYLLFYSKYDPETYQKIPKIANKDVFSFDNFTIRQIDWREDQYKKGVLFIGSPWVFNNFNPSIDQNKKKFFLLNGQLILMAVSP